LGWVTYLSSRIILVGLGNLLFLQVNICWFIDRSAICQFVDLSIAHFGDFWRLAINRLTDSSSTDLTLCGHAIRGCLLIDALAWPEQLQVESKAHKKIRMASYDEDA
jgi:hypothetical protein